MSEMKADTPCKACKYWACGLWDFPCRACSNEGRSMHPYPGDKMGNHYKRHPKMDIIRNLRLEQEKKREMGL